MVDNKWKFHFDKIQACKELDQKKKDKLCVNINTFIKIYHIGIEKIQNPNHIQQSNQIQTVII